MNETLTAYVALLLLLPASLALSALVRPPVATAVLLVGAVMFMPERVGWDLPGLPSMDKLSIAAVCALVTCIVTSSRALVLAKPGRGVDAFAFLATIGALGTALTNRDIIAYGPLALVPMTVYDGLSTVIRLLLVNFIPFFLGRALFRTSRDLKDLILLLAGAGLVYMPLVLLEVRLSPQLHNWIYGFAQHSFAQTIRGGGYRPMCFMAHGLALAMFMLTATLASLGLSRVRIRLMTIPSSLAAVALVVTLALVKSTGAMVYAIVLGPLTLFGSVWWKSRIALVLAILVAVYPILRASAVFPTEGLVDLSAMLSQERAQSLKFRFDNEDALLAKARERPWFGWGSWGRGRVYDEQGVDTSVTDGAWIIGFGSGGIVGWGSFMGLLLSPIFVAARHMERLRNRVDRMLLSTMSLVVAVNAVDLLPNGLFSYLPLFLAGCLSGLVSGLAREGRCASTRARTVRAGSASTAVDPGANT